MAANEPHQDASKDTSPAGPADTRPLASPSVGTFVEPTEPVIGLNAPREKPASAQKPDRDAEPAPKAGWNETGPAVTPLDENPPEDQATG